jgi:hypothetical protein
MLAPLIFGDNQFFGVNHMSEERARAQAIRFRDISAVMDVLADAQAAGIGPFMCTTHERIAQVCNIVRADRAAYPDLVFYPCMPYAHKYAQAVTEDGMLGSLQRFLPQQGLVGTLVQGATSLVKRDVAGLARLLVDAEMKMFRDLPTPVIFLQNVVVDLLLGLGAIELFAAFAEHVRTAYGAEPGFITMNLPRLLPALREAGVDNPIVCANINMAGFRMSGGVAAYRAALEGCQCRVIAMSVFASGALPADAAIKWVAQLPNISALVFGASSRSNIEATAALVETHFRPGL